jgi:hypothetical protein
MCVFLYNPSNNGQRPSTPPHNPDIKPSQKQFSIKNTIYSPSSLVFLSAKRLCAKVLIFITNLIRPINGRAIEKEQVQNLTALPKRGNVKC